MRQFRCTAVAIIFILTLFIFSFSLELQNTPITIEKQRENIHNTRQRQREDVFESIANYYNSSNSNINIDSSLIAEIHQLSVIYTFDFFTFLALIDVESTFDHTQISPTGAIGLCQITTIVEEEFGNKYNRKNKDDNLLLGAMFFSRLIHVYKYELKDALIHYNAGTSAKLRKNGIIYAAKVLRKKNKLTASLNLRSSSLFRTH